MASGHPNFKREKAGVALSAKDLNALKRTVESLVGNRLQRLGYYAGGESIIRNPRPTKPVKLVWGRIIERIPVGTGTPPPTGAAGAFTYKAEALGGSPVTPTFQRPLLACYNDVPDVIAAPTYTEDRKNSLCIIAIDAPDSDGNPSVQLIACRERLNFELCPETGTQPSGGQPPATPQPNLPQQLLGLAGGLDDPPPGLLSELLDFDPTGLVEGDMIRWDATADKWERIPASVTPGGDTIPISGGGGLLADGWLSFMDPSSAAKQVLATPNATSGTPSLRALVASDVPGTYIATQVLTSGTSYTRTAGATKGRVRLVGGGGGGGGAQGTAAQAAAAGGGASGAVVEAWVTLPSTATYAIGGAGAGGTAGNNNGSTGGDTVFDSGGLVLSAGGGSGGQGGNTGTTFASRTGGAGSDGDLNGSNGWTVKGVDGAIGLRISATQAVSGVGAACTFGGGGGAVTNATGKAPTGGYGGGGGGAATIGATNRAGGDGMPGIIIVEEYA